MLPRLDIAATRRAFVGQNLLPWEKANISALREHQDVSRALRVRLSHATHINDVVDVVDCVDDVHVWERVRGATQAAAVRLGFVPTLRAWCDENLAPKQDALWVHGLVPTFAVLPSHTALQCGRVSIYRPRGR